jgi:hypothetical protein
VSWTWPPCARSRPTMMSCIPGLQTPHRATINTPPSPQRSLSLLARSPSLYRSRRRRPPWSAHEPSSLLLLCYCLRLYSPLPEASSSIVVPYSLLCTCVAALLATGEPAPLASYRSRPPLLATAARPGTSVVKVGYGQALAWPLLATSAAPAGRSRPRARPPLRLCSMKKKRE